MHDTYRGDLVNYLRYEYFTCPNFDPSLSDRIWVHPIYVCSLIALVSSWKNLSSGIFISTHVD